MAIEKEIVISLPDGETDAVVLQPEGAGAWPGILFLTDIGGIRAAQRQMAGRLADEGYVVLMPNVFYRTAKPPVMDLAALRPNPEMFMARVRALAQPLTPEALERDAIGYVDTLSRLAAGQIGVVGFCICGGVAMRVAAACPDLVAAAASFHGGNLFEQKPESPHWLLPRIRARLLFGHAEGDRSMPAEAIAGFEQALRAWGGRFESQTYAAAHGWMTLDNPAYDADQAERGYAKLAALFRAELGDA